MPLCVVCRPWGSAQIVIAVPLPPPLSLKKISWLGNRSWNFVYVLVIQPSYEGMCSKVVVVVVWDMYVGPHSAQAFTQYTRTYMIYVRAPHSILCELTWRSVDTHCGAFYSSAWSCSVHTASPSQLSGLTQGKPQGKGKIYQQSTHLSDVKSPYLLHWSMIMATSRRPCTPIGGSSPTPNRSWSPSFASSWTSAATWCPLGPVLGQDSNNYKCFFCQFLLYLFSMTKLRFIKSLETQVPNRRNTVSIT